MAITQSSNRLLTQADPTTNPSSGREEDLNPRLPDYKSSALTHVTFPFYQQKDNEESKQKPCWTKKKAESEEIISAMKHLLKIKTQIDLSPLFPLFRPRYLQGRRLGCLRPEE